MQDILKWTIDRIRADETMMSWLEERKFDWVPLVKNCVSQMINGVATVVITDTDRNWFAHYVLDSINCPQKNRPLLPIFHIKSIYPHVDTIKSKEDLELVKDMLSITFKNDYIFWYIGKSNDPRAKLALSKDDGFYWVLDDEIANSFLLNSNDLILDFKLLQLYRIFDKTISAAMFSEIDIS